MCYARLNCAWSGGKREMSQSDGNEGTSELAGWGRHQMTGQLTGSTTFESSLISEYRYMAAFC